MAGRHRKPSNSTPAVTAAKIAITGAVLGGSSLTLTNHASAAIDNEWDQAADTLSVFTAHDVPSGPPTDAALPAPDPAEEVTAPPPEQAAFVDSAPEAPPAPRLDPPIDMPDAPATRPVDDTATATELVSLVRRYSGTPYIWGGDSPAGTDCSGLASWLANLATGRPVFGDRFDTSTEESALLARGFQYGTAPGALVIGWNNHHTAVTLADGTPVSSGEGGGIRIGGQGAYEAQFTHHMFLPIAPDGVELDPAPADAPAVIELMNSQAPPPEPSADPVDLGDAAI